MAIDYFAQQFGRDVVEDTAPPPPDYNQMVLDAYASIGRTGVGGDASQVDPAGLAGWRGALESGQIKPEDWNTTFQTAVKDYIATNPDDKYSQYVNNYLGNTTADTNTGGITNLLTTADTANTTAGINSLLDTNTFTAVDTPNYKQMVIDAYGTIGRTGVGSEASNIDQAGLDAWTAALQSGQIKPEDWNKTFQAAVTDYIATNPDNKYTKYVQEYLGLPTTTPTTVATTTPTTVASTTPTTAPTNSTATLFENTFGRKPTEDEINRFGDTIDAGELSSFLGNARNEAVSTMPTTGAVGKVADQILSQGTTQYWGGEGFGSAKQNAYDMAAMLVGQGITNINDFGKVPVYADVQEIGKTYNGQRVIVQSDEDGKTVRYINQPTGKMESFQDEYGGTSQRPEMRQVMVPKDAKLETVYGQYDGYETVTPVDSSKLKTVDGKLVADTGQTTFGNTKTGKAINAYYDKAAENGPDVWSGTFAGDGSTAYGVKFTADGKPIFYSKYGGSSNDLANLMADLGPVGQIGLAIATGGLSIPQQIAAQLAVQVLSGVELEDAIGNAAVSFAMSQIPGTDFMKDGASFIKDLGLSEALTSTLTNSLQNSVMSGAKAVLTNQNIGDAMLQGAVTGGVNGAVNSLLGNIEGFGDLTANQKKIVANAVTGVISNKPLDQIVINSAIAAANSAVKDAKGTKTSDASDVISTLQNAGLTEDQLADAALFNTGEKITLSADAQSIVDELAAIQPDQLAFAGALPGIGSAAAAETAALLQRAAATPAGQAALRQAASTTAAVRDALIASGIFTAAGLTSFIAGNQLVPPKLDTVTQTTNTDLINQIPRDTIDSLVNRTVTPTTAVQTVTAQPTTQVATTAPTTYVVQPGDYTDTTEVVQPWQSINPTTQVAQPDASRLASMLGVNVDTAANLLRIYPSLFGEDEAFTPADLETMTSTNLRLLESGGGGADDNIVIQKPSNDTVVARDSEGQAITYGDLVNIIGTNKVTTQPTTTPTTQSTVQSTTQPTVQTTPTTQVSNQVTTTPTTETTTRVTPTTEVITETTPTTEATTKPTTEATTQTTVTPTTEVTTAVTPTTTPTTEVTTKPTTEATTKVTPTTEVTTKVTPTTEATTKPTTATQTTVTPTTATQTTTKPTTATQTTVTPTTATQTTTTPTTATQTTTTPTTTVEPTVKPTVTVEPTVKPTTTVEPTVEPTVKPTVTTTVEPTVEPTVQPTVTTTVEPTVATVEPTVTTVKPTVTTVKPTVTTVKPTVKSTVSGYTMPQAQNIAAAFGIPALANVFYYGKEFGSKKQKLDKKGGLEDEDYRALSVTKAGAEGEMLEDIAEEKKNKENNANDALDLVLGESSDSMSLYDLINIVKGG